VFSPEDFRHAQASFLASITAEETMEASIMRQRYEGWPKPAPLNILSSDVLRGHPASRTYASLSKFHVPSTMIRPVPQTTVIKQRNTKARRSEIWSWSPYKNSLQEKLREKAAEDGEKKAECRWTIVKRSLIDRMTSPCLT
jgi:hypothetical protein